MNFDKNVVDQINGDYSDLISEESKERIAHELGRCAKKPSWMLKFSVSKKFQQKEMKRIALSCLTKEEQLAIAQRMRGGQ